MENHQMKSETEKIRKAAKLLLEWADEMDGTIPEMNRRNAAAGMAADAAPAPEAGEPKAEAAGTPPLSLPEVRKALADKCARGYAEQVKSIILSFGVEQLKDIAPERYPEVMAMAEGLGGETDA